MNKIVISVLLACLSAPLLAGQAPVEPKDDELETLYGLSWNGQRWQARVKSSGCTYAQSFRVEMNDQVLSIIRVKPDLCRAVGHLVDVDLDGVASKQAFTIKNPIKTPKPHW